MMAQAKRYVWKLVLGAAFALVAFNLPAATAAGRTITKPIYEKPLNLDEQLGARFNVDRDLGRAWVEVLVTPDYDGDEVPEPDIIKEEVDGLSYDRGTKQVIYQHGRTRAVCANDSTFLWSTALKETGQCKLQVSSDTEKVDDGFDVKDVTMGKVALQVQGSRAAAVSSRAP